MKAQELSSVICRRRDAARPRFCCAVAYAPAPSRARFDAAVADASKVEMATKKLGDPDLEGLEHASSRPIENIDYGFARRQRGNLQAG